MYYGKINNCDIANGVGVRISLFVSGCTHHCKGCFNEVAWDFKYGFEYTAETEAIILEALKPAYIAGITILGGEPFELANQHVLVRLLDKIRATLPTKDIWCYTGYTLDTDILPTTGKVHGPDTIDMLHRIDVLVDGEFQQEFKSLDLVFRGSSNQRIINVPSTLHSNNVVLLEL